MYTLDDYSTSMKEEATLYFLTRYVGVGNGIAESVSNVPQSPGCFYIPGCSV